MIRRSIRFLGVAFAIALTCATLHAQTPGTPIDKPALAAATERGDALLKTAVWDIPQLPFYPSTIISDDKALYFRTSDGKDFILTANDAATGKQLWHMEDSGNPVGVTSDDQHLLIMQNFTIPNPMNPASRSINELQAINLADRSIKWKVSFEGFQPLPAIAGNLVVTGAQKIYVQSNGFGQMAPKPTPSEVRALDSATGKQRWAWPLPEQSWGTAPFRDGSHRSITAPLVGDGGIYFILVSANQPANLSLQALHADDGKPAWNHPLAEKDVSPPALQDNLLVYATAEGEVVARSTLDGAEKWRTGISPDNDLKKSRVNGQQSVALFEPPIVDGDLVLVRVFASTDPPTNPRTVRTINGMQTLDEIAGLAAFDLHTGKQRWFFRSLLPAGTFGSITGREVSYQIKDIQPTKDTIVASATFGDGYGQFGVDRQTGRLDWFVHANGRAFAFGDVLYLGIAPKARDNSLIAIPAKTQPAAK